jgi:hypothetical protein
MTRPRKELISLADTPYYHITSRCVRRAYLCGVDHYSGQKYEHRRQGVVDRIRLLSSLFAIDICARRRQKGHTLLPLGNCSHQVLASRESWVSRARAVIHVLHIQLAASMRKNTLFFIGLDTHKEFTEVAYSEDERTSSSQHYGKIKTTKPALLRFDRNTHFTIDIDLYRRQVSRRSDVSECLAA